MGDHTVSARVRRFERLHGTSPRESRLQKRVRETAYLDTLEPLPTHGHAYDRSVVVVRDVYEGGKLALPACLVGRVLSEKAMNARADVEREGVTLVYFSRRGVLAIRPEYLRLNV